MADKNVRYLNPINIETSKEKYCRFKKNGIKYVLAPKPMARKPVAIGFASAMEAAAKAPSATGGVINDNMPQYKMNRCTASGLRPPLIKAGARMIARKM